MSPCSSSASDTSASTLSRTSITPSLPVHPSSSSSFRLIHRTNHTGYFILPEPASRHFPIAVIWTQVDWSRSSHVDEEAARRHDCAPRGDDCGHCHNTNQQPIVVQGCCPRDGRRVVTVMESDFSVARGSDHGDGNAWYLYCVQVFQKHPHSSANNTHRKDVYYKFVVSPTNRMNGIKKRGGLKLRKGMVMVDLTDHLIRMRDKLLERERVRRPDHDDDQIINFHFHVGLVLPVLRTGLDTPRAIYEYQIACYKAIEECDDETALDDWIQRGRTKNFKKRTRYQPHQMSETIPQVILVDRSCSHQQSSSFSRNLKMFGLNDRYAQET